MDDEFFDNLPERLQEFIKEKERNAAERAAKRATEIATKKAIQSQMIKDIRSMIGNGVSLNRALYLLGIPKEDKNKYISLL